MRNQKIQNIFAQSNTCNRVTETLVVKDVKINVL